MPSKQHHFIVYGVETDHGEIVWDVDEYMLSAFPDGTLYDPLSDSMEGWSAITQPEDEDRDARICEDLLRRLMTNRRRAS